MLKQDFKYALRMLATNRGLASAAVLTLVIGVLLNTCVFGLANAVWFRPLPFREVERMVVVNSVNQKMGLREGLSYQECLDMAAGSRGLESAAAFSERFFNLSGAAKDGSAERAWGGIMSANAPTVLGIRPIAGRVFTADEQAAGAPVAIIGEVLWRNRFASDPGVIGREIKLDGRKTTIVGVMPKEFRFIYTDYDVLAPLPLSVLRAPRSERSLAVVGRLKPGVGIEQAQADLAAISARLEAEYPATTAGWRLTAASYRKTVLANANVQASVMVVAATFVLLIVCGNISNLFLAKAASRQREVSIRMALGASRFSVVRQMLAEGLVIAFISGGLSMIGACWLRQVFVASFPHMAWFVIDFRVLVYTLAVSAAAGIMFGLGPALAATRPNVNEFLKSGTRGGPAAGGGRLRNVLVISELALGLMLLAGAGLLAKTVAQMRNVDVGYRTDNLLSGLVSLQGDRYAHPDQRQRFWTELVDRLRSAPGVADATVSNNPPLSGGGMPEAVEIEGRARRTDGEYVRVASTVAGPHYFQLFGQRLLAGREFGPLDTKDSPGVAVINERFANKFWPGPPATVLGNRFRVGKDGPWLTVVGVASNIRQALNEPAFPELMRPLSQSEASELNVVVRAAGQRRTVKAVMRHEVRALDPDTPLLGPSGIEDLKENFYPMVMIVGIGVFALVALALAALGLHGVVSFLVVRRTHEIGLRMALGATRAAVLRMVLGQTLKLASIGAAIGLAGAFGVAKVLESSVPGFSPADPVIFAIVTAVLGATAVIASAVPALRASRVSPLAALRYE